MEANRMGAMTPEATALWTVLRDTMEDVAGEGLDDVRLREMITRAAAPLMREVSPDVGDWAQAGLVTRATLTAE